MIDSPRVLWQRLQRAFTRTPKSSSASVAAGESHHAQAAASLRALLDDPQEWASFGRPCAAGGAPVEWPPGAAPQDAPAWESHVVLSGMHCAACALTIEEALHTYLAGGDVRRAIVRVQSQLFDPEIMGERRFAMADRIANHFGIRRGQRRQCLPIQCGIR